MRKMPCKPQQQNVTVNVNVLNEKRLTFVSVALLTLNCRIAAPFRLTRLPIRTRDTDESVSCSCSSAISRTSPRRFRFFFVGRLPSLVLVGFRAAVASVDSAFSLLAFFRWWRCEDDILRTGAGVSAGVGGKLMDALEMALLMPPSQALASSASPPLPLNGDEADEVGASVDSDSLEASAVRPW